MTGRNLHLPGWAWHFRFQPGLRVLGPAPGELPEVLVGDFDINGDAISDILSVPGGETVKVVAIPG